MIKREHYLNQIIDLIDKDIIKILTGVRRSGKSVLLQQVVNHLKNNGIKEENIIFIDLESPDFLSYSTINDLNEYIKSKSNKKDKYYLFFDEIQRIEGWQRLVNAYFSLDNFDVYVTGSNSKLLSGEFATYLTGRYINIKIFPFSFVEYLEYNKDSNLSKKELFMDYLTFGGFPASFELDNKIQYLNDLFDSIVFNDIKQELVDKGLAAYQEAGIEAHGYVCDVTDEDAVNAFVAKVEEEVGTIDILVNNAGIIKRIPMLEMSAKDFRQVIDIDLNGPFIVSKAVIPGMIKKGHGKIINICSMMSELGRETVSAYAAAKGGLKMLTRNICSEYGEYNIQCNGIGPGYIATPQTAPLREKQPDGSRHPFDQFIVSKTPAARWGEPQDLMGPAVFLASDASNFVNGHVLYVDGGILAYIGKQPE